MIDIESLTLKDIVVGFDTTPREIGALAQSDSEGAWKIGKVYLIRTVTYIVTGRLVRVHDQELVLEDAAWVADTGRFSDSLKSLEFNEVEPFPDGELIVGRGAVVDACIIAHTQRNIR